MNAYKEVIGRSNQNLTNGKVIYWRNVRKLIKFLADNEYDNLMDEYKIREKWERRNFSSKTEEDKKTKYLHIPIKNREMERYINPYEKFGKKDIMKRCLILTNPLSLRSKISINYMEGLEWVMNYYTTDCIDWRWCYRYNYPPLFKDLLKFVPAFNSVMIEKNNNVSVSPTVQLSYVLPIESFSLIPNNIGEKLLKEKPEYYTKNYKLNWAFCKFMWESHLELPHIDIDDLEDYVNSI